LFVELQFLSTSIKIKTAKFTQAYRTQSILIETYFTLTQGCQTGIINAWHYHNLVGAKL
jgi:hypothetical protein